MKSPTKVGRSLRFNLLLTLLCVAKAVAAQSTVVLEKPTIQLQDFYGAVLVAQELSDGEVPTDFQPLLPNMDVDQSKSYWLKFKIQNGNEYGDGGNWVIDFARNDFVELRMGLDHFEKVMYTGYLVPGSRKQLGQWNALSVHLDPGASKELLIRLKQQAHYHDFNLTIRDHMSWTKHVSYKLLKDVTFQGILFIIVLYNLILFAQTRFNGYLQFALYLLMIYLFFIFASGLLRDYILIEYPESTLIFIATLLLAPLFYWGFLRAMIDVKSKLKRTYQALWYLVIADIGLFVIAMIFFLWSAENYRLVSRITQGVVLVNIGAAFFILYRVFKSRDPIGKYFVYGSIVMLLSSSYDAILWDSKPEWGYVSRVGFVLEILFFSVGLGKKVRQQLEESQERLGSLVSARTSELEKQRNFYQQLFDEVPTLVFVRDQQGKYIFLNKASAEVFDLEIDDVIGKTVEEVYSYDDQVERVKKEDKLILQNGEEFEFQTRIVWPGGEKKWVQVNKRRLIIDGKPYVLGVLFDIGYLKETEQKLQKTNMDLFKALDELKSTESKMIETEKMASIGQLTSGLAHEIGNPINYVSGNVKPLIRDVEDIEQLIAMIRDRSESLKSTKEGQEVVAFVEDANFKFLLEEIKSLVLGIEDGTFRVKQLVTSLRNFSRTDQDERVLSDINLALQSTIRLIQHNVKHRIKITIDLDETLPKLLCIPGKLSQVFLNLIDNAIHAISGQGEITIKSSRKEEDLVIEIGDTGEGIPEDIKHKIFEPFFTTKEVGKGTGLGLAISSRIISEHNGRMIMESEVGQGTTFMIYIPLQEDVVNYDEN
ncbi:MAG: PAS domain S-box protein [Cyclobacteriaceae bacterium]|nr:PAS domain S-box protein [Cyclobacteriaceae bacterium HetDA_MAG_MS6]